MKTYKVIISRRAGMQLTRIDDFIAAGHSPERARVFMARVATHLDSFDSAPRRGRLIAKDVYRSGFERTLSVIVRVKGDTARILGVHYRGERLPSD